MGNAFYGLESQGDSPSGRAVLRGSAPKICTSRALLGAQAGGMALYGLRRQSDRPCAGALLQAHAVRVAASPYVLGTQALGIASYGLQWRIDDGRWHALPQTLAANTTTVLRARAARMRSSQTAWGAQVSSDALFKLHDSTEPSRPAWRRNAAVPGGRCARRVVLCSCCDNRWRRWAASNRVLIHGGVRQSSSDGSVLESSCRKPAPPS